jgi:hypothetical protein
MVKKVSGCAISFTSFSSRLETRTARIGPSGGVALPNRFTSALVNGRSQAKALPATVQARRKWPKLATSTTSGSAMAMTATPSNEAIGGNLANRR